MFTSDCTKARMPPRPRARIATVLSSLQHPYIYFQHFSRLIKMSVTATRSRWRYRWSRDDPRELQTSHLHPSRTSHSIQFQSASPRPLAVCPPPPFCRGRAPPWIHCIHSACAYPSRPSNCQRFYTISRASPVSQKASCQHLRRRLTSWWHVYHSLLRSHHIEYVSLMLYRPGLPSRIS